MDELPATPAQWQNSIARPPASPVAPTPAAERIDPVPSRGLFRRSQLVVVIAALALGGFAGRAVLGGHSAPSSRAIAAAPTASPTPTGWAAASHAAATPHPAASPQVANPDRGSPPSSSSPHPSALSATLDVQLAAACVSIGGRQTITVHTRPTYSVVFNTYYRDGSEGTAHAISSDDRPYGGGYASDDGTFAATWTVASGTPTGDVELRVGSSNGSPPDYVRTVHFQVAAPC